MIETRRLGLGDLVGYRELHRFGLRESAHAFVESIEEDAARADSVVTAALEHGEAWGAFEGGKLVAKLTMDQLPYAMLAHTRWIHAMYAHPDARGTGAAHQLVRAVIEDARANGATRIMLWANAENARAARFYGRLGFREVGRVPGGIMIAGRQIDDVLMCLQCDDPR